MSFLAVSSHHTCRDLMVRLERQHSVRVLRFYEIETGASILPCELIVFLLWKLKDAKLYGEVDPVNRGLLPAASSGHPRKHALGVTDTGADNDAFLWCDEIEGPASTVTQHLSKMNGLLE